MDWNCFKTYCFFQVVKVSNNLDNNLKSESFFLMKWSRAHSVRVINDYDFFLDFSIVLDIGIESVSKLCLIVLQSKYDLIVPQQFLAWFSFLIFWTINQILSAINLYRNCLEREQFSSGSEIVIHLFYWPFKMSVDHKQGSWEVTRTMSNHLIDTTINGTIVTTNHFTWTWTRKYKWASETITTVIIIMIELIIWIKWSTFFHCKLIPG